MKEWIECSNCNGTTEAPVNPLAHMFKVQYELQERLETWEKIKNPQMRQQFINQMILAIQEEAVEIMRETAYKNPEFVPFGWKKTQVENTENFKEEIIDLFHFVMNLAMVSGMDSKEFYERYLKKNKINHDRQDNNY